MEEKGYELGQRLGEVAKPVTAEERRKAEQLRDWSRGEAEKSERPPVVEKG